MQLSTAEKDTKVGGNMGDMTQKTMDAVKRFQDEYNDAEFKFLRARDDLKERCDIFKKAALWEEEHFQNDDGSFAEHVKLIDWRVPLEDVFEAANELFSRANNLKEIMASYLPSSTSRREANIAAIFKEVTIKIERFINTISFFSQAARYEDNEGKELCGPSWSDGFDILLDAALKIEETNNNEIHLIMSQMNEKINTEMMLCVGNNRRGGSNNERDQNIEK